MCIVSSTTNHYDRLNSRDHIFPSPSWMFACIFCPVSLFLPTRAIFSWKLLVFLQQTRLDFELDVIFLPQSCSWRVVAASQRVLLLCVNIFSITFHTLPTKLTKMVTCFRFPVSCKTFFSITHWQASWQSSSLEQIMKLDGIARFLSAAKWFNLFFKLLITCCLTARTGHSYVCGVILLSLDNVHARVNDISVANSATSVWSSEKLSSLLMRCTLYSRVTKCNKVNKIEVNKNTFNIIYLKADGSISITPCHACLSHQFHFQFLFNIGLISFIFIDLQGGFQYPCFWVSAIRIYLSFRASSQILLRFGFDTQLQ